MISNHDANQALASLYESMLLIRRAEERAGELFAAGKIPGFLHLSLGQEAVPAGICAALGPADTIASTHRGHGHALAKGVNLERFFAELMGRADGLCAGRGGSIHVAEMSVGMLGANGIVGGGLPLGLGSAWAHQVQGKNAVAVAFFGDGALAEGAMHECLNIAALWKLPILFVCENNGWSEFSPIKMQLATTPARLAASFKIHYEHADGVDVEAVAETAQRCVMRLRQGIGPVMLECMTSRWHGHYEGDPQKYRPRDDLAEARAKDPLVVASERLNARGLSAPALAGIMQRIEARIDGAIAYAESSPEPSFAAALADVFAPEERHG